MMSARSADSGRPEHSGSKSAAASGDKEGVPSGSARGQDIEKARRLALRLAERAEELKAEAVKVLDVRGLTDVFDFMVLATGGSERHTKALADALLDLVKSEGDRPLGIEGTEGSGWILVDLWEIVVHVFSGELRRYYDLDGLWADAKTVSGRDGAE